MAVYDIDGNPLTIESELTEDALRLGVHLMPKSMGELNMVRRARQLTDIKWTPAATIRRTNNTEKDSSLGKGKVFQDSFVAGTEYKGIPYSHGYYNGAYRNFAMVGYQVSLEAFATSAQFADSYFCSADPWNASDGVYTPYGITCDTLGCYAMGLTTWYGSNVGFQNLVRNGTIVAKFNGDNIAANINNVHLGDILWKKEVHVAVITDVVIDPDGTVNIEVSEATTVGSTVPEDIGTQYGGIARRELWPLDKFLIKFPGYTVYRYSNSANVSYTPSPFVHLQGEAKLHNLRDRIPLIPYMGSGFAYLSGHIPNTKILIGSTSYDYVAVYKDGTLFNTFTIGGASYVTTNFSSVGSYEAFLFNSSDGTISNMTDRTVSCTWSVISA